MGVPPQDHGPRFVTFPGPGGQTLSYLRRGSGPLIVCVPGGPGLDPEAYFAGSELPGREMLIFAPRGTGLSVAPDSLDGYRIVDYVADLDCLRSHLEVDRLTLYGNSYGGSVVLAYASAHPDRVERLVISNAPVRVDRTFGDAVAFARQRLVARVPDAARRLAAAEAADAAAETEPTEAARRLAHRASMACGVAHEGVAEAGYLDRLCAAPRNLEALSGMWIEWREGLDLSERLSAISAPALLISGELDTVVPPEVVRPLADAMTNARYVEIPDVGHFVHIEANEQFRSIVGDFLT